MNTDLVAHCAGLPDPESIAPPRQSVVRDNAGMQRWTFAAFGALFAAAIVVVLLQARGPVVTPPPVESASTQPSATPPPALTAADAGAEATGTTGGGSADAGGFNLLPNGKPVPPLPATAPKSVGFGAILFAYEGAQSAPKSAPSKQKARERAEKLIELAKKDFDDAVKHGDPGSTADAGHIPRGVLEPAAQYILFTLPKGHVYEKPIDTPRGYWIVRRND